jgi:NADH-quinone oxidoreductase subunit F
MLERIDNGDATPMDIEIMAQVQSNIIGNCLCVLGDSMAMPIGSMIEKFRPEFERHMEEARRRNGIDLNGVEPAALASDDHSGPMPTVFEAEAVAGRVID